MIDCNLNKIVRESDYFSGNNDSNDSFIRASFVGSIERWWLFWLFFARLLA